MATDKPILRGLRKVPTRRSLFGPVERDQLLAECQAALRKDLEEASRRWAFDFVTDQPLEGGDYLWEVVPSAKVPQLYRSTQTETLAAEDGSSAPGTAGTMAQRTPLGLRAAGLPHDNNGNRECGNSKERVPRTPERCVALLQKMEKTPEKDENGKLKRKQTNITDFYQSKRRVVGTPWKSSQ